MPKYIKQILTEPKGETYNNTTIVGDFSTPFTSIDRSSRQKINKKTPASNATLEEMDLTDIYITFHPKVTIHIFLKYTWNILQDGSYVRSQNIVSSNLRRLKSYQASFLTTIV